MIFIAGAGAASGIFAACTFGDLDGLSSGGLPSDGGGAGAESSATDSAVADGNADLNETGVSDAGVDAGACAGDAGPKMVNLGKYCIDSTEVSAADYAAFVAAGVPVQSQPPECAFNTSFSPKKAVASDNLPARYVNWCDARAYCLWAGKHLCGGVTGGPALYDNPDLNTDAWFMACSQNHTRVYPYGQTLDTTACNADPVTDAVVFVGTKPKCEGGFPGLFDMGGNVREWEDACESVAPDAGEESCVTRGGASDDPPTALNCDHRFTDPRKYTSVHLGFRCCSDAL